MSMTLEEFKRLPIGTTVVSARSDRRMIYVKTSAAVDARLGTVTGLWYGPFGMDAWGGRYQPWGNPFTDVQFTAGDNHVPFDVVELPLFSL